MNLTKENYEFLMFELLEGNLTQSERSSLLKQINSDAFYQKEWVLMQHAVAFPDEAIIMEGKDDLLKPVNRRIAFIAWPALSKIAASLILIGSIGWFYYASDNSIVKKNGNVSNNSLNPESQNSSEDTIETKKIQVMNDTRPSGIMISQETKKEKLIDIVKSDSNPSVYKPEILLINPLEQDKIAYNDPENIAMPASYIHLNKPKETELSKTQKLLVKTRKISKTAKVIWNDIPNLTLKMTSKRKGKKPTFQIELKGEIIYANAIIEIK